MVSFLIIFKQRRSHYNQASKVQPILTRHSSCDESCLDFKNIVFKDSIVCIKRKFCSPLSLQESQELIKKLLDENQNCKRRAKKMIRKYKKIKKSIPLTIDQRNSVIAFMLQVTPGQVRMNKSVLKNVKVKQEIHISNQQKSWLLKECSKALILTIQLQKTSESILKCIQRTYFPKDSSLIKYKLSGPIMKTFAIFLKIRQKLRGLQIYRINMWIYYNGLSAIDSFSLMCALLEIFPEPHINNGICKDLSNNHQKESVGLHLSLQLWERKIFLFYQVIEGTGKAFIFKYFFSKLLMKAEKHYDKENFVFILDNATVHKNEMMAPLLNKIPHIFTPSYRPNMNAIKHLFSWIKRYIVKEQPFLFGAFQQTVHHALSSVNENLLNSWIRSILKPIYRELSQVN